MYVLATGQDGRPKCARTNVCHMAPTPRACSGIGGLPPRPTSSADERVFLTVYRMVAVSPLTVR
jgi:hypothetical protein